MPNFANTLEQHNEFRRDFNRVLRFSNGLSRAENQHLVQHDLETGTLHLSNDSGATWLTSFLRAFVNTPAAEATPNSTASQQSELVWKDTISFINDIKNSNENKLKEQILNFVAKIINNTNNSKHLTQEQKDLILDKLFADPYKNTRYAYKVLPIPMILVTTLFSCYFAIKFLMSYDTNSKSFSSPGYGFATFLSVIALVASCAPRCYAKNLNDPIAEDAYSLIAWAHEVSDELLRLQIPCEPDPEPIASAVIVDTNDQNNFSSNLYKMSELFNKVISCLVYLNESNADSLLQNNTSRRRLDKFMTFMSEKIIKNNSSSIESRESAVKMFLQIRSEPSNMTHLLRKFLEDCQSKVHQSPHISDSQRNALLDLIISNRESNISSAPSFEAWLYEMDDLCNRLTGVYDPIVIHDGEAVGASANSAVIGSASGHNKHGYKPVMNG